MRIAVIVFGFLFLAAVEANAQVSLFSESYQQYVNPDDGSGWSVSSYFQPSYTIWTNYTYSVTNTDPNNSYVVTAWVYCWDANGTRVATASTTFTVPAADPCVGPGSANGSEGLQYLVPSSGYTNYYKMELKLTYEKGLIADDPNAYFTTD